VGVCWGGRGDKLRVEIKRIIVVALDRTLLTREGEARRKLGDGEGGDVEEGNECKCIIVQ